MQFLIGVVIAGVVTFFVVEDAKALRAEEIQVFGSSQVSPGLWGTGVFLLMIVFLPAYIFARMSHNKKLVGESRGVPVAQAHVQPQPPATSTVDEIAKAYALLERGAITNDEFLSIKARVLPSPQKEAAATEGGVREYR